MKIRNSIAYNQEIGKSKLLSSVSGVGSIVTSKFGNYILINSINTWKFVRNSNSQIAPLIKNVTNIDDLFETAKTLIQENVGIKVIGDERFVKFLRREKELMSLICLIEVPSINLKDNSNKADWEKHPINLLLKEKSNSGPQELDYMVVGTHFPRWFKNSKHEFKEYKDWKRLWLEANLKEFEFAPPRDTNKYREYVRNFKGTPTTIRDYDLLEQINLILICSNGHLSDIPWPKYLRWKTDILNREPNINEKAAELFRSNTCCNEPNLSWTESRSKSEGYQSIFLECKNCGKGSGSPRNPKVSLEGINNIKPNCIGQKPWETENHEENIPYAQCRFNNVPVPMQLSLATGNSIYFSNTFTSIFLPSEFTRKLPTELEKAFELIQKKYDRWKTINPDKEKQEFAESKIDDECLIIDCNIQEDKVTEAKLLLKSRFLDTSTDNLDFYEDYRHTEYECLSKYDEINHESLTYKNMVLDATLTPYFEKLVQIQNLKVTQTQLDFSRIKPAEPASFRRPMGYTHQNTYSTPSAENFVLPAHEIYGEGLFLKLNEEYYRTWLTGNSAKLEKRYERYLRNRPDLDDNGFSSKIKIFRHRVKYFLIHTLSHSIMRGLEFICGYPTASLKERLYISDRMLGLLIYTAEGSEGSMGGLISQAEKGNFKNLIMQSLQKSITCSSDPICWESPGQGLFDLNLASCFSCCLLSEISCEEMNLILDRRVLIDEEFGFFKTFVDI